MGWGRGCRTTQTRALEKSAAPRHADGSAPSRMTAEPGALSQAPQRLGALACQSQHLLPAPRSGDELAS